MGKWRNRKVAISEFRDPLSEMDIRELKLLAEFSHKNIVKFVSDIRSSWCRSWSPSG